MLADQDLPELNPEPNRDGPTAEAPVPPARAVVVIRERPRFRLAALVPPALILLIAFAVLTLRVRSSDWRGWTFPETKAAPTAARSPTVVADHEPVTVDVVPPAETSTPSAPEAGPVAATLPEPEPQPEPEPEPQAEPAVVLSPTPPVEREADAARPAPRDGLPITLTAELFRPMRPDTQEPDPVAAVPTVEVPEGDADPRRVWADLRREAQANADERERLADLKPLLQQRDEVRVEHEKADRQVEERRDDLEQRTVFLKELRKALLAGGTASADAIRRLTNLPMDEPIPRDPNAVERARALAISINDRRAWIVEARTQGIDESMILSDLALAHLVNVVARSGPRSEDDALIRASRELLAIPTDLTAIAAPTPVPPGASSAVPSPRRSSRYGASHRR